MRGRPTALRLYGTASAKAEAEAEQGAGPKAEGRGWRAPPATQGLERATCYSQQRGASRGRRKDDARAHIESC